MKAVPTLIVTLVLFTQVKAEEPVHFAKILDITGEVQRSPEFEFSGPKVKPNTPRHWIEIEAEVEVGTTDPSKFIPELKAEWFAVIRDEHRNQSARLVGHAIYRNVRTSDKRVFLSAYIDPDTMERFTGNWRARESDIEGYALILSGTGILAEGEHGKGLVMATAKEEAKWWVKWDLLSYKDMIVPKSETPFAYITGDRYPKEKETGS